MRSLYKPETKTARPLTRREMVLSDRTRTRTTRRGTRTVVRIWVSA